MSAPNDIKTSRKQKKEDGRTDGRSKEGKGGEEAWWRMEAGRGVKEKDGWLDRWMKEQMDESEGQNKKRMEERNKRKK